MKKNSKIIKIALQGLFCLCLATAAKAGPNDINEYMRVNLYYTSATGSYLLDGTLTQYDPGFNNGVDINDAWKLTNPGENFGIARNGNTLIIEKRKRFLFADTTTFRMWNLLRRDYSIEVITFNCDHPNVLAVLEDKYLGTATPINCNGTTRINFSVTADAGTYAPDRFRVVFKFNPFKFGGVRVIRNNGDASIRWKTMNEESQVRYEVERSMDGIDFKPIAQVSSAQLASGKDYAVEEQISTGDIMYRIKSVDNSSNVTYSEVARLFDESMAPEISVYPNPVINRKASLFLNAAAPGDYQVVLSNTSGAPVYKSSISNGAGQINQTLLFPTTLPGGVYILRVCGPDKNYSSKKIIVQ